MRNERHGLPRRGFLRAALGTAAALPLSARAASARGATADPDQLFAAGWPLSVTFDFTRMAMHVTA